MVNFLKSRTNSLVSTNSDLNAYKQTFPIFHMRISQKVKGVLNVKSSTYYFHMKTKILAEFQICISVPLIRTNMAPCFIKFISDSVTKNCKFITKFSFLFEVNKVNLFLFFKYYIPTQVAVVLSSESQYCVMLSHELPSQVPVN